jgi:Cu-Zn family superoxide dismutase
MKSTLVAVIGLLVYALGPFQEARSAPDTKEAVAVIQATAGSSVKGIARFTQEGGSIKVVADLEGLEPNSQHGFHIHEFGDCSAPDAMSAGSHYDAAGTKHHGQPMDSMRHTGDMGNITADAGGKVHFELGLSNVTIDGAQAPILGRAVIVHAKADDFSQPVGNAGSRLGCGVIGIMKPSK